MALVWNQATPNAHLACSLRIKKTGLQPRVSPERWSLYFSRVAKRCICLVTAIPKYVTFDI